MKKSVTLWARVTKHREAIVDADEGEEGKQREGEKDKQQEGEEEKQREREGSDLEVDNRERGKNDLDDRKISGNSMVSGSRKPEEVGRRFSDSHTGHTFSLGGILILRPYTCSFVSSPLSACPRCCRCDRLSV